MPDLVLPQAPWLKCRGWGVMKLVQVFLLALLILSVSLVGATTGVSIYARVHAIATVGLWILGIL